MMILKICMLNAIISGLGCSVLGSKPGSISFLPNIKGRYTQVKLDNGETLPCVVSSDLGQRNPDTARGEAFQIAKCRTSARVLARLMNKINTDVVPIKRIHKQKINHSDWKRKVWRDGPKTRDIKQGNIGNCYLQSSMAALANTEKGREILRKSIQRSTLKKYGAEVHRYFVTFYWKDEKILVEVSKPRQWNKMIIEAHAALLGSYGRTKGGVMNAPLYLLTGYPAISRVPQHCDFKALTTALDQGVVTCSGIQHAYAIVKTLAVGSMKYVRLFNPHNSIIDSHSANVDFLLGGKQHYEPGKNDSDDDVPISGMINVPFTKFQKIVDDVTFCNLEKGAQEKVVKTHLSDFGNGGVIELESNEPLTVRVGILRDFKTAFPVENTSLGMAMRGRSMQDYKLLKIGWREDTQCPSWYTENSITFFELPIKKGKTYLKPLKEDDSGEDGKGKIEHDATIVVHYPNDKDLKLNQHAGIQVTCDLWELDKKIPKSMELLNLADTNAEAHGIVVRTTFKDAFQYYHKDAVSTLGLTKKADSAGSSESPEEDSQDFFDSPIWRKPAGAIARPLSINFNGNLSYEKYTKQDGKRGYAYVQTTEQDGKRMLRVQSANGMTFPTVENMEMRHSGKTHTIVISHRTSAGELVELEGNAWDPLKVYFDYSSSGGKYYDPSRHMMQVITDVEISKIFEKHVKKAPITQEIVECFIDDMVECIDYESIGGLFNVLNDHLWAARYKDKKRWKALQALVDGYEREFRDELQG